MIPRILLVLFISAPALTAAEEKKSDRSTNTVILDPVAVRNLGLDQEENVGEVSEEDFDTTEFALGRIEVLPGKRAVVSTRIAGRAYSVIGTEDMKCEAGDELLSVESRLPGAKVIVEEAPIAGLIAKVNVAQGQPIEPSMSLMEIYDLSTVEAVAAVPQHLAGKVGKGMQARIRVPGYADTWTAELAHTGAEADAASGTVEASFHVKNDDGRLRPGMRAEFELVLAKTAGVIAVPREAVLMDPAGRYLFIHDYELKNAYVKRYVVTGVENDRFIEIKEGLLPGDEVVKKGSCAYALSFAGKGSVSLKEALDAAHGHPHNEDGSEMTKEQQAAHAAAQHGGEAHDHAEGGGVLVWQITSGVLAVLLVLAGLQRKSAAAAPTQPKAA